MKLKLAVIFLHLDKLLLIILDPFHRCMNPCCFDTENMALRVLSEDELRPLCAKQERPAPRFVLIEGPNPWVDILGNDWTTRWFLTEDSQLHKPR